MKIICFANAVCFVARTTVVYGHSVLTRTKWNSREFNYFIRSTSVVTAFACVLVECVCVCVCVLKVRKNPYQIIHRTPQPYNEILQASENGKMIHMKQTTLHTFSYDLRTQRRNIFHLLCVCARFISFQSTFPCISSQHSPHRARYMCVSYILFPDFFSPKCVRESFSSVIVCRR